MALFRPRLTDYYGILLPQADLDFAIPFLDEDIPLYADPFLLWRSPSQQDQALHANLLNAFNHLGYLCASGQEAQAVTTLIAASECDEVGLGSSVNRQGKRIGEAKACEILELFKRIPQYNRAGFRHFEEIQFFVDGISKDRISDFTCSFLKSFLIDFTLQQCEQLRQITMEMKNVAAIERQHVDQLNRYLADELGRFGLFITRYPLNRAEFTRTIDLWSGQRKVIVTLTDTDIAQMVELFESKQRSPIDVVIKKYGEFRAKCP